MWSYLSRFFNMSKSLELDSTMYPFVPCHDNCENDCEADIYFTKKVRERYQEIGIDRDKTKFFLRLISYVSNKTHSFLSLKNKDVEVDECLKLMKVLCPSDVKEIFCKFQLTKDSSLNNCPCCLNIQGRVLHVQLQNIFKTCSYTYYMFNTLHGSEICFGPDELKDFQFRYEENHLIVSPMSFRCLKKGDYFYITLPIKKYLNILAETLCRYVQVQRPCYIKLPHATTLMAVVKLSGSYDREEISPIGQLMDAWVLDGRRIYFLSAENICSYDFRVGVGPLQHYSKWVRREDVYLLNKFIRKKVQFQGTLLVPESSALFQQYLMKRHSPRSVFDL